MDRTWEDDHDLKMNKIRFKKTQRNEKKCQSKVTIDHGRYGIKYYLSITKQQSETDRKNQNWTSPEMFDHFTQCFSETSRPCGRRPSRLAILKIRIGLHPIETALRTSLLSAISITASHGMACSIIGSGVGKKDMTPCLNHYGCWKESLQNVNKLPAGVKLNPTKEETKEWFYRRIAICF